MILGGGTFLYAAAMQTYARTWLQAFQQEKQGERVSNPPAQGLPGLFGGKVLGI